VTLWRWVLLNLLWGAGIVTWAALAASIKEPVLFVVVVTSYLVGVIVLVFKKPSLADDLASRRSAKKGTEA